MMKINEMAKRIGVSVKILQRWDNDRTLIAHKSPKWRRYYTEDQYLNYIGVVVNEIDTIYITYKDRFVRFGYDWFEKKFLFKV